MINQFEVFPTPKFDKDIEKLSEQDQKLVFEKIEIIKNNPFYQSRKVEGLVEDGEAIFRTRINRDIRLFWQYKGNRIILMLRVGHHDIWREI